MGKKANQFRALYERVRTQGYSGTRRELANMVMGHAGTLFRADVLEAAIAWIDDTDGPSDTRVDRRYAGLEDDKGRYPNYLGPPRDARRYRGSARGSHNAGRGRKR